MRNVRMPVLLLVICYVLTGCSSFLEREYRTEEPHSSKYWETGEEDTMRAESYQDVVNDLLLLISKHTEKATIRIYKYEDELTVASTLERATTEVQQETPMGAYALDYITYTSSAQRTYYEVHLQIGYRRSAEQIQNVVSATSVGAVKSLLEAALAEGKTELAVRIGYWEENSRDRVETVMDELQSEKEIPPEKHWIVHYYPENGTTGLVEFMMEPEETIGNCENSGLVNG